MPLGAAPAAGSAREGAEARPRRRPGARRAQGGPLRARPARLGSALSGGPEASRQPGKGGVRSALRRYSPGAEVPAGPWRAAGRALPPERGLGGRSARLACRPCGEGAARLVPAVGGPRGGRALGPPGCCPRCRRGALVEGRALAVGGRPWCLVGFPTWSGRPGCILAHRVFRAGTGRQVGEEHGGLRES